MLTEKRDLDSLEKTCKRAYIDSEARSHLSVKDFVSSQNSSMSVTSPAKATKRTRTDGCIAVCDKQPRVHYILQNSNGEDVHSIYYEINQFLGELHFQRQVRELRNRLAAQQSPSKSSAF
jgi:hypothetical protein